MNLDEIIVLSDNSKEIRISAEEFLDTIYAFVRSSRRIPSTYLSLIVSALSHEYELNYPQLKVFLNQSIYSVPIYYQQRKAILRVKRVTHYLQYTIWEDPTQFARLLLLLHISQKKATNEKKYREYVFGAFSFFYSYLFNRFAHKAADFFLSLWNPVAYDAKLRIIFAFMEPYHQVVIPFLREYCKRTKDRSDACKYFKEFPIKANWRKEHKRWRIKNEYRLAEYGFGLIIL